VTPLPRGRREHLAIAPEASRAYASTVHLSSRGAEVAIGADVVRWLLPGGWVTTGWGEPHGVPAAVDTSDRPVVVPA
jgi:thiamine pyrophosphate-dependent acetolactate synthase large subunit-like protein